jgi:hypothetical protein
MRITTSILTLKVVTMMLETTMQKMRTLLPHLPWPLKAGAREKARAKAKEREERAREAVAVLLDDLHANFGP